MSKVKDNHNTLLSEATEPQLRAALEALGYGVIIWSPEDFPSQEAFEEHVDTVIDICISRGNDAIGDLCPDEDEDA